MDQLSGFCRLVEQLVNSYVMSPPFSGVEGQSPCNIKLMAYSTSADCISQNKSGLKERNYLGLSDATADSSTDSSVPEENKKNLNLKATELRLGLPGSQSPERDSVYTPIVSDKIDEKQLFPLAPSLDGICSLSQKTIASGSKRGFSDTIDGYPESKNSTVLEGNWMFNSLGSDSAHIKLAGNDGMKTEMPAKASQESNEKMNVSSTSNAPAAK